MRGDRSVLVAMSGGVDSTAAAALLLESGWRCQGAMMGLHRAGEPACRARRDRADAEAAAARLGIPFEVLPFEEDFQREVVDKFIRVYQAGGTPNPCVDCNRCLKFGRFLQDEVNQIIYKMCSARGNMYGVIKEILKLNHGLELGGVRRPLLNPEREDSVIIREAAQMILRGRERYL